MLAWVRLSCHQVCSISASLFAKQHLYLRSEALCSTGAGQHAPHLYLNLLHCAITTLPLLQVPEAVCLTSLSYHEAWELSYFGASVMHPRTTLPAMRYSIPITIRNFFNQGEPGEHLLCSTYRTPAVLNLKDTCTIHVSPSARGSQVSSCCVKACKPSARHTRNCTWRSM